MTEITVSRDVYWVGEDMAEMFPRSWLGDPIFLVAARDVDGAGEALTEALGRFMLLDDEGRELSHAQARSGLWSTPRAASGIHLTDRGLVVYVDCGGEFTKARGQVMIEILVAELWCRDVSAHVCRPPEALDWIGAPRWVKLSR